MMNFLPMFPLNLVVYPGEKLNLHIFEPRYKQLISDAYEADTTFGIPTYLNEQLQDYGTEVSVDSIIKTYDDGRMDISTRGLRIFSLVEFIKQVPEKLYSGAVVTFHKDEVEDNVQATVNKMMVEYSKQLYEVLKLDFWDKVKDNDPIRSFDVGHHVGFTTEQEYDLLRIRKESHRQLTIIKHLKKILPIVLEAENLREKVNLNGHFKKLNPPF